MTKIADLFHFLPVIRPHAQNPPMLKDVSKIEFIPVKPVVLHSKIADSKI
ncbi:MAG: hypothetical protein V1775_04185 [Bacteroidota bacterium]